MKEGRDWKVRGKVMREGGEGKGRKKKKGGEGSLLVLLILDTALLRRIDRRPYYGPKSKFNMAAVAILFYCKWLF